VIQLIGLVPLACAAAYLLLVAGHFPRIISDIHLNPDADWAPVLARDLASGGQGGHILVGAASHFTTIWFLVLTRWLPFRDTLWDVFPFLTYLAGLGFVAWACRQIAGTWSALVTFAIGVCGTAAVLLIVMAEGLHGATFAADGIVVAFLVFWATRSEEQVGQVRVATVGIVLLGGATLASDPLFLPSGLGPFTAAPLALWLIRRDRASRRMAVMAAGITAASVIVAVGVTQWMEALGFEKTYETGGFTTASPSVAIDNMGKFVQHLRALGNSTFSMQPFGPRGAWRVLMTAVLVGAVALPFLLLFRSLRTVRRRASGTDDARFLYLTYWVLSGLAIFVAFSVSTFAEGPSDSSHYVMPVFFAVAATAPMWAARADWRRVAVSVGVTVFGVLSISSRHDLFGFEALGQKGPVRSQVIAFLETEGVSKGYTGYFDSHPLTLQANLRVHFYPVIACRAPMSSRLCPLSVNTRTSWYVPRPGIRTFLLFDSSNPAAVASAPTADLGPPAVTRQFGPLVVYVYGFDIGSKLASPCNAGSPSKLFCPETVA
jgi:hypothetical protein